LANHRNDENIKKKKDKIIINKRKEYFSFKKIQDVNDVPFVQALVSVAPRHTVNGTNEGYGWWSAVDKEELRRVMNHLNPRHVFNRLFCINLKNENHNGSPILAFRCQKSHLAAIDSLFSGGDDGHIVSEP